MSDSFDTMIETSLNHVGSLSVELEKAKQDIESLAYIIYGIIGGDGPENGSDLIRELGFTDEDGEWIDSEDDEEDFEYYSD